MKKLVSQTQTFGPFDVITQVDDGYDCDGTLYPYTVVGVCQIEDWVGPLPPSPPYDYTADNKALAESLLQQTDWATIPSVADPAQSNPYLMNSNEFIGWRSQIRAVAITPPTTLWVPPDQPVCIWGPLREMVQSDINNII
jgi:hypothetical protein